MQYYNQMMLTFLRTAVNLFAILIFVGAITETASATTKITFNLWERIPYNFAISQIKTAQELLIKEEYITSIANPTGFYGSITKNAVMEYQKNRGLEATGIIGSLTRRVMNDEIALGMAKNPDSSLQKFGNFKALNAQERSKVLSVPLIEQSYPLSCEAASLQMALLFKGVNKNQEELIKLMGFSNPKLKYKNEDGKYIWGDPNIGFVGDIKGWLYTTTGGMIRATGWGINNKPVSKTAILFRPKSTAEKGISIQSIIKEIDNENPIIVWQYSPIPKNLQNLNEYLTPDGKSIKFIPTHVNLIVGYKLNNITGKYTLLINDPDSGRIEVEEDLFISNWSKFNYDMVVVR